MDEMKLGNLIDIAFRLADTGTSVWNFYFVVVAAILGWVFSSNQTWSVRQKLLMTALFGAFAVINFVNLIYTYNMLGATFGELKAAAGPMTFRTPEFHRVLQSVRHPQAVQIVLMHLFTDSVVVYSIWGNLLKREPAREARDA